MSDLVDSVVAGLDGELVERLAAHAGLERSDVEDAIERQLFVLAGAIEARIETDDDARVQLFQIVDSEEQVAYLDDPDLAFSDEAADDGRAILALLWGDEDAALSALDAGQSPRLARHIAAFAIAAMASQYQALPAVQAGGGEPGFFSIIFDALLKGLLQGLNRRTRRRRYRRRRRRRSTSRRRTYRTRRRTTRRRTRRRKTSTLGRLIRDLLKG